MAKTVVEVKKAGNIAFAKPVSVIISSVIFFVLGIAIGSGTVPVRLPSAEDVASLRNLAVGAVGAINFLNTNPADVTVGPSSVIAVPEDTVPDDAAINTSGDTVGIKETAESVLPAEIPLLTPPDLPIYMTLSGVELDQYILDQRAYIERLTRDIDRIRNTSIQRTAEFSRNCNNWNAYCANEYRTDLDGFNREYNRLTMVLDGANIALTNAVDRQNSLRGF